MGTDYTGIIRAGYVVRHRSTGEYCVVELGARYNQLEWELLYPIHLIGGFDLCLNLLT